MPASLEVQGRFRPVLQQRDLTVAVDYAAQWIFTFGRGAAREKTSGLVQWKVADFKQGFAGAAPEIVVSGIIESCAEEEAFLEIPEEPSCIVFQLQTIFSRCVFLK